MSNQNSFLSLSSETVAFLQLYWNAVTLQPWSLLVLVLMTESLTSKSCAFKDGENPVNEILLHQYLLLFQVANSNLQAAALKSCLEKLHAFAHPTADKEVSSKQMK